MSGCDSPISPVSSSSSSSSSSSATSRRLVSSSSTRHASRSLQSALDRAASTDDKDEKKAPASSSSSSSSSSSDSDNETTRSKASSSTNPSQSSTTTSTLSRASQTRSTKDKARKGNPSDKDSEQDVSKRQKTSQASGENTASIPKDPDAWMPRNAARSLGYGQCDNCGSHAYFSFSDSAQKYNLTQDQIIRVESILNFLGSNERFIEKAVSLLEPPAAVLKIYEGMTLFKIKAPLVSPVLHCEFILIPTKQHEDLWLKKAEVTWAKQCRDKDYETTSFKPLKRHYVSSIYHSEYCSYSDRQAFDKAMSLGLIPGKTLHVNPFGHLEVQEDGSVVDKTAVCTEAEHQAVVDFESVNSH